MSWADGSAIPSQAELDAYLEEVRGSKARLREVARQADAKQARRLAELAREGASIAGLHLPPEVGEALAIIRRAVSMLGLLPLEGAGLSADHAAKVRELGAEATEALDILQALAGK